MKIACLGGGPAGLYFAISMKLRDAAHDITVFERNRPDDTFGWGVVFSEETFDNITANDPVSAATIRANFAYWDDIAVHYRGERIVSSGHGFSGIGRKKLLMLLQERARQLGVDLRFQTEIADANDLAKDYDVVIVSFDPNDTPRQAASEKQRFLNWLGDPAASSNVHFLTGTQPSIDALTTATGFHYVRVPGPDGKMDQFAHSSVILVEIGRASCRERV